MVMTASETLSNHGSRLAMLEAGQKRLEARIAELLGEQTPAAESDGRWRDASGHWRNQAGELIAGPRRP